MLKRWKTLKSKRVFSCPWYHVNEDDFELPNKKIGKYFITHTKPSVMILPLTTDNKIIFIKQYRYPVNHIHMELPAGSIEKGETAPKAAKKELEEEAGFITKNIKEIGKFAPINGLSSEICHVFLAKKLVKTKQKLDPTELIEVKKFSIEKAYKMVDENKIECGMTLAALSLARKYLENICNNM